MANQSLQRDGHGDWVSSPRSRSGFAPAEAVAPSAGVRGGAERPHKRELVSTSTWPPDHGRSTCRPPAGASAAPPHSQCSRRRRRPCSSRTLLSRCPSSSMLYVQPEFLGRGRQNHIRGLLRGSWRYRAGLCVDFVRARLRHGLPPGGLLSNKFGVASGSVSSSLSEGQATLLGPMNVKVTLIDNAGNSSNSVVVPVAHWLQW